MKRLYRAIQHKTEKMMSVIFQTVAWFSLLKFLCEISNVFILNFEVLSLGDKLKVKTISLAYKQEKAACEKPELLFI